ncbi:MAG: RimK family alpha-L-glutamate ligase, partial [Lysobacter sp.]
LRQFELMDTYTPNSSDAILKARDKLRCHQLLAAEGIDLPATVFGDNPDDTTDLLSMLGPPPHVIKLNEGTQGAGVMLTEKPSASRGVIEALRGLYANFLVQEFIEEAQGADLRCFVVGGKVVAAMKRQAPKGDFRSNLHRGGSAKGVKPSSAEKEVAVRAARVLGLGVAGVDLIRSRRGPLVLEVNASPGLEGIEEASGVDVAGEIITHVANGLKPQPNRRPMQRIA